MAEPAQFDGEYLANFHQGEAGVEFQIRGNEGYVHNGHWSFDVLEFNPPHLKFRVQATGSVMGYDDVVKA